MYSANKLPFKVYALARTLEALAYSCVLQARYDRTSVGFAMFHIFNLLGIPESRWLLWARLLLVRPVVVAVDSTTGKLKKG